MTAATVRIVVVDDRPLFRGTICNMLAKQPKLLGVAG
jgi:chemotaxis response regulator CheB